MLERIYQHIEESRIYQRPNKAYAEIKLHKDKYFLATRFYYPFSFEFYGDYSSQGLHNIYRNSLILPRTPIHIEMNSEGYFCSCFRSEIPTGQKYFPRFLHHTYLSGSLLLENKRISSIFNFETNEKFLSSISFRPFCTSFSIFLDHFGFEFLHDFEEEQMSISFFFNKYFKNTAFTILGSIYGNLTTLITTDLKFTRISSLLKTNIYTLSSEFIFGASLPFFDHSANISISIPTRTISFEISLNKLLRNQNQQNQQHFSRIQDFKTNDMINVMNRNPQNDENEGTHENESKRGITFYLPICFKRNEPNN